MLSKKERESLEFLLEDRFNKSRMKLARDIIVKYDEELRSMKLGCLCQQIQRDIVHEFGLKLLEMSE